MPHNLNDYKWSVSYTDYSSTPPTQQTQWFNTIYEAKQFHDQAGGVIRPPKQSTHDGD